MGNYDFILRILVKIWVVMFNGKGPANQFFRSIFKCFCFVVNEVTSVLSIRSLVHIVHF